MVRWPQSRTPTSPPRGVFTVSTSPSPRYALPHGTGAPAPPSAQRPAFRRSCDREVAGGDAGRRASGSTPLLFENAARDLTVAATINGDSNQHMRKFRRLLAYAAPHRQAFGVIGLLTFLASVLAALQQCPLKLLVDHVLRSKPVPAVFQTVFRAFHLSPTPSALLIVIV